MTRKNILHEVGYNSQRDNFSFAGKFPGYKQCFSTSSHMFLSYYSKKIDAKDDNQLSWLLDQVEASVGIRGVAERYIKLADFIPYKRSSYWWDIQKAGINYVLSEHKKTDSLIVNGSAEWIDTGTWDQFNSALNYGPLIVGTNKMGDLPGGHIVLCVGVDYDREVYYLNDPYGNPLSKYKDYEGGNVEIPMDYLKEYAGKATKKGCVRYMFLKPE